MSEQKYSIGVNKEDFDKFIKIHESTGNDNRAQTFHYLITNFEAPIA